MESKDLVNEEKEELLALLLKEEGFGILPEQEIEVHQLLTEEAQQPFDLISAEDRTTLQWLRNRTGRTDKGGA